MKAEGVIPVALFCYARPAHTARVLGCLRANQVPLLLVFADGARGAGDALAVAETRALVRAIDWCEVHLVERRENLGLARNILAGVTEVAARHAAFLVWEDDLACVPGTYAWLCAALRHYADDPRVMSVTGWTHPRVTPPGVGSEPYCDGRAECWVWGAWARSWRGMPDESARAKMAAARRRGIPPDAYGADLPQMAAVEEKQNIWAVRWLYHHLEHGGLCVRPPWSLVEHIGFDASATNAAAATRWANPVLRSAPPVPAVWPEAREAAAVRGLWRRANPAASSPADWARRAARWLRRRLAAGRRRWRGGWRWFRGDYVTWEEARRAATGYDDAAILARVVASTHAVREGRALWERDGVAFQTVEVNRPLLEALRRVARETPGRLEVVDFGGALGSSWWQHRWELTQPGAVRWCVVEQPHYVAAGREFTDDRLRFADTLAEAVAAGRPAVVLFSSVLPYVEHPKAALREAIAAGFRHVIIDRTPFQNGGRTRLAVQHTPPALGGGSYPCWLFDRADLLEVFGSDWELLAEWPALDALDPGIEHRGYHFRRK